MSSTRRRFLTSATALAGAAFLQDDQPVQAKPALKSFPIACNSYSWLTFYARQGKTWMADPDASLAELVQSGMTAYEPGLSSVDEVTKLLPLLTKHKLAMHSLYVNSTLHKADEAQKSIDSVLAIAEASRPAGTSIFVTNPSPISWGTNDDKTDAELAEQARNLDRLGGELRKRGITLAYHTHTPEHRQAAREFHHMLLATDPKNVSLCLDAHWVYRGSGNSQIALFDVVKLYGKRIVEVHIRQSKNKIWQETFGEGDIDYQHLSSELSTLGIRPNLVLEQCLEKETPNTMGPIEAHKQDLASVKRMFAGLIGS
ncbi:sugar phosphate isomerase/epimerase family protein [Spirosoma pollinicola]|uniref:Xylose isomerase n=1 Tax=Spirosoma pollinicola TaxID=2057025 RepID=A0A2K8Z8J1_9BACT|nr:TIM barrel protein [Spirosoma pollinicola]AUD06174.1 xylose isomerase [Spirosoma pollinicola]